ncbi:MAG: 2-amino-4-hydroxy-6-hydroxymethyldihydropteridine diphosphokinase [Muribaculaceae bacterium]|nr:2-amino-4-hydroxy-6-hydroxymethyldihydropteridine diphosphokinase [Muribaculaceae bacterium]
MLRRSGSEEVALMPATAYINLGSNIGDRMAHLERAVAAIRSIPGASVRVSAPFHSAPWGYDSPNDFINVGLALELADIDPRQLLDALLRIERSISPASHRTASGAYADRVIDIDLIAVDGTVLDVPGLTLPHPRMHQRTFVLKPMAELAPEWRHPLSGLTPAEMLALL